MKFTDLSLAPELLSAIERLGYDQPSPIQEQAIPVVLAGKDIMAAAQTGTGKTAAFTLPVLDYLNRTPKAKGKGNQARVLVLTPTRELAAQVADNVEAYSSDLKIKSVVVFGGVKINPQMQRLRGGADVLIATPGRLLDLHQQNAIQFDQLEVLVLDEADRMLDMGFIHDIKRLVKLMPKRRQTLLFSATFSNEIRALAKSFLYKPVEVSVTPPNSTVDVIEQRLIAVEKQQKTQLLAHLITTNDWFQVLVFCRTRHGANRLAKKFAARGIDAAAIHGDKSQNQRTRALADFKAGKVRALIATDIAARGIDIDQLPHVVNFDLPQVPEDYVHRIGRTGRAGASGEALSLVSHDEFPQLQAIETLLKKEIPRIEVDGFEPLNNLPASRPARSGKPAGQKQGRSGKAKKKPATGKNRNHNEAKRGSRNNRRRKKSSKSGQRNGNQNRTNSNS